MPARTHPSVVLAGLMALSAATARPAAAQLTNYGSGLGPSENLSTPPDRRHGGYWDSTSANREAGHHRHRHRQDAGRTAPPPGRDKGR